MSVPSADPKFLRAVDDAHKAGATYLQATCQLRWRGRELQQLWIASDGSRSWRSIPEADLFDPTPEDQ